MNLQLCFGMTPDSKDADSVFTYQQDEDISTITFAINNGRMEWFFPAACCDKLRALFLLPQNIN